MDMNVGIGNCVSNHVENIFFQRETAGARLLALALRRCRPLLPDRVAVIHPRPESVG